MWEEGGGRDNHEVIQVSEEQVRVTPRGGRQAEVTAGGQVAAQPGCLSRCPALWIGDLVVTWLSKLNWCSSPEAIACPRPQLASEPSPSSGRLLCFLLLERASGCLALRCQRGPNQDTGQCPAER